MKIIILIIIILFIFISFNKNNSERNEWTGFYYPDKNNIGNENLQIVRSNFDSLQSCRNWVINIAKTDNNYDYECGYKCKKEYEMYICEKTTK